MRPAAGAGSGVLLVERDRGRSEVLARRARPANPPGPSAEASSCSHSTLLDEGVLVARPAPVAEDEVPGQVLRHPVGDLPAELLLVDLAAVDSTVPDDRWN